MNNIQCVCVNIFQQLSQMLQSFSRHSTSSSTFTHDGGFGTSTPEPQATLGTDGRFSSNDSTNMLLMFALIVLAMFTMMGGAPQRQDVKVR